MSAALDAACARIAPSWPLDRYIAVSPLWGFVDRPLTEVSAQIGALMGARTLMPARYYLEAWRERRFGREHLARVLAEAGVTRTPEAVLAGLEAAGDAPGRPTRRALMVDVADAGRDLVHGMAWRDVVAQSLGQAAAAWFDEDQALVGPARPTRGGLYASWLDAARRDRGPTILTGLGGLRERFAALPEDPRALVDEALAELGVPAAEHEAYLLALLLDLAGWASAAAYRRFVAHLAGRDDDALVGLAAMRLAWELVLLRAGAPDLGARWRAAMATWAASDRAAARTQGPGSDRWLAQEALELAYREALADQLVGPRPDTTNTEPPRVQAAFCIDVRSEVLRRALEAEAGAAVHTHGLAGFFGIPLEHLPLGATRPTPRLPGPLAPRVRAAPVEASAQSERAARKLDLGRAWARFKAAAGSGFSFVEALGPLHAVAIGAKTLRGAPHRSPAPRPVLVGGTDGEPLGVDARAELAEGLLRAAGLVRDHARLIALIGHGARATNNPHAAGLDCGACGGHPGDVNARVAVDLLEAPDVRAALALRGLPIPDTTRFVAGLHETTTDTVTFFDRDRLPATHHADLAALEGWLAAAGARARAERAERLPGWGLAGLDSARLAAARRRANDWAELRPEWGLADNAAFIIAPRSRTRSIDLGGRVFLHDYRWQDDPEATLLAQILTAPVVVAHGINLQYWAATVDNDRFGSGDKLLHNVVGGHLGVFEGQGGDLRVGLPRQSVHDGTRWVHTPRRLAVFVEAPAAALDAVLERHPIVRQLVGGGWIHLARLDPTTGAAGPSTARVTAPRAAAGTGRGGT